MTTLQQLAGTYLVMTARVTCRACFEAGKRGPEAWVIDPRLCPSLGGPLAGRWHRAIVAAAKRHFKASHPEIVLP